MKPPKSRRAWNSTIAAPTKPLPSKSRKRILSDAELTTVGQTYLPTSALPLKKSDNPKAKRLASDKPRATGSSGRAGNTSAEHGVSPFRAPRRSKIKKKPRTPAQFARIYGSAERVAWIQARPCVVCGWTGGCENAHIVGGGVGRKSGYANIVPLCGAHPARPGTAYISRGDGFDIGCHAALHSCGIKTFQKAYFVNLVECAAKTEAAWQSHLRETVKHRANWSRS